MASPAAVLSILIRADTARATAALARVNAQLNQPQSVAMSGGYYRNVMRKLGTENFRRRHLREVNDPSLRLPPLPPRPSRRDRRRPAKPR